MAKIKWQGKQVAAKMLRAEIRGIDRVLARCVPGAKTSHEWKNRGMALERSIGVAVSARRRGTGAAGEWGSQDVVYARVHELGSEKLNIPARPYLRPQADIHYPTLPGEIRKAFK